MPHEPWAGCVEKRRYDNSHGHRVTEYEGGEVRIDYGPELGSRFTKPNGDTVLTMRDGSYHTLYADGRVQRTFPDGSYEVREGPTTTLYDAAGTALARASDPVAAGVPGPTSFPPVAPTGTAPVPPKIKTPKVRAPKPAAVPKPPGPPKAARVRGGAGRWRLAALVLVGIAIGAVAVAQLRDDDDGQDRASTADATTTTADDGDGDGDGDENDDDDDRSSTTSTTFGRDRPVGEATLDGIYPVATEVIEATPGLAADCTGTTLELIVEVTGAGEDRELTLTFGSGGEVHTAPLSTANTFQITTALEAGVESITGAFEISGAVITILGTSGVRFTGTDGVEQLCFLSYRGQRAG